MLFLSYYAYVFSSTKSVIRAKQDLPETEGRGEKGGGGRQGAVWRNDLNNVCTCE
jgi:hypothetical protein